MNTLEEPRRDRQRGQVLVLFAGALILMLAVSALVIDIGFTLMLKRQEQNAVDPGAIAAARYITTGTGGTAEPVNMREAACRYAQENGFFQGAAGDVTACIPANDADGAVLTVNYPPSWNAGPYAGSYAHVEVVITRTHWSFLAGLIGIPSITVSSSAVGAHDNGNNAATPALLALDPGSDCGAAKTHGTGDILMHAATPGGPDPSIHVNATCASGPPDGMCSTSGQGALSLVGSGTLTATTVYVSGTCKGGGTLAGDLVEGAVQIGDPLQDLPGPSFGTPDPGAECGVGSGVFTTPTGAGAGGCDFPKDAKSVAVLDTDGVTKIITVAPGVYYGGWSIANRVKIIMQPGIYVFAGGGIRLNAGGSVTSVQASGGAPAPVLIYNTDNPVTGTGQASIDLTAQGTLKLAPLDSGPYKNMLLWNDGTGSNPTAEIDLGGQVSLDLSGTIYNPKGHVKIEGGSGTGSYASIQIISWTWDVGGNSLLDMPYDPDQFYRFPTLGLVR